MKCWPLGLFFIVTCIAISIVFIVNSQVNSTMICLPHAKKETQWQFFIRFLNLKFWYHRICTIYVYVFNVSLRLKKMFSSIGCAGSKRRSCRQRWFTYPALSWSSLQGWQAFLISWWLVLVSILLSNRHLCKVGKCGLAKSSSSFEVSHGLNFHRSSSVSLTMKLKPFFDLHFYKNFIQVCFALKPLTHSLTSGCITLPAVQEDSDEDSDCE